MLPPSVTYAYIRYDSLGSESFIAVVWNGMRGALQYLSVSAVNLTLVVAKGLAGNTLRCYSARELTSILYCIHARSGKGIYPSWQPNSGRAF
jgi:hypothetical protein